MAPIGTNAVENHNFFRDVLQSIFLATEESSSGHPRGRGDLGHSPVALSLVQGYTQPLFVLKQLFAFSFLGSFLSAFCFFVACDACEYKLGWET